jgi:hypothetical protein
MKHLNRYNYPFRPHVYTPQYTATNPWAFISPSSSVRVTILLFGFEKQRIDKIISFDTSAHFFHDLTFWGTEAGPKFPFKLFIHAGQRLRKVSDAWKVDTETVERRMRMVGILWKHMRHHVTQRSFNRYPESSDTRLE